MKNRMNKLAGKMNSMMICAHAALTDRRGEGYASPFTDRNDCCMSHHSNPARDLVIREAIPIFVVLSQKNRGCK